VTPSPLANIGFGVVVVLLAAVIVVLYVATRDRIDTASGSGAALEQTGATRQSAGSSSESEPADPSRPLAVVIGDSFSTPPSGADEAWPGLLGDAVGSDVRTYAEAQAAYVAGAGSPSMADLVERAADDLGGQEREAVSTVLLAGGRYDTGEGTDDRAEDAATELVAQVREDFPSASVVVLSNFASGKASADGDALARSLATAADVSGAAYVDVTDFLAESDIAPDGVNPTEEGQARLAERVEDALRRTAQS